MLRSILFSLCLLACGLAFSGFCGFYVSQADADLFNESSEVIIARQGDRTTITMSSDFQGDVRDFAMVVPVPTILQEQDIRVAERSIFDKLDTYSGPRLVEYHDNNPCQPMIRPSMAKNTSRMKKEMALDMIMEVEEEAKDYGVTIEATYTVGEYDILILSAKESDGLQRWLEDNNYQIPAKAQEVLRPYIKNNFKFFVVKVDLEQMDGQVQNLRPIQMSFNSNRFGLPIRLGMANADGFQDMIVYAFSDRGRIETTNYRTVKIPTDRNIPTFIEENFSMFYKDLFERAWKREGKNVVFLEYAWDLSSSNFTKCDPCTTNPPTYAELAGAGVHWVDNYNSYMKRNNNSRQGWNTSADYMGEVFMTRLHVRYDRQHFPQDLRFQVTPNKKNFQGRYIMQHEAKGDLSCRMAGKYIDDVVDRKNRELDELAYLTNWDVNKYEYYISDFERRAGRNAYRKNSITPALPGSSNITPPGSGTAVPGLSISNPIPQSVISFFWAFLLLLLAAGLGVLFTHSWAKLNNKSGQAV